MRVARPTAALLALCLAAPGTRAAEAEPSVRAENAAADERTPPSAGEKLTPLPYDWTVDGVVTGALVASTLTLMLLQKDLAPLQCRWCTPGSVDGDLAKSVPWTNPKAASTASDVLQLVVPLGIMGYGLLQAYRLGDPAAGWSDVLLVTEATSLAMLTSVIVKYAVGRARPYVWLNQPDLYGDPAERYVSFFSNHTTFAFAVAASAGTLYLMQGMPGAPFVLGAGLAVAALTGYLRMASSQHYLSDVLTGAAVGSLIGWAVPYLFHRPRKGPPQAGDLRPAPGGIAIAW